MSMTEPVTAREAEVEQVTKGKLMEDLRAVVADAEELLKATADQTGERIAAARGKAEESLKAAKALLAEQEAAVMAKTNVVASPFERSEMAAAAPAGVAYGSCGEANPPWIESSISPLPPGLG